MKESFDQKFAERLANYQVSPDEGLRKTVLAGRSSGYLPLFYRTVGTGLVLLAFFMIGYKQPNSIQDEMVIHQKSAKAMEAISSRPARPIPERSESHSKSSPDSNDQTISAHEEKNALEGNSESQAPPSRPEVHSLTALTLAPIEEKVFSIKLVSSRRHTDRTSIVPKKKGMLKPFVDVGTSMQYQSIKPNVEDQVVISNFRSPGGLSSSRIGYNMQIGAQKSWGGRLQTRLGLAYSNYGYNFQFRVRDELPSSVIKQEGSDKYEAAYGYEEISASGRVNTLGLKLYAAYSFPSAYNALFISTEYQKLMGQIPGFQYNGKRHQLMKPGQVLLELGLRKLLIDTQRGRLYAIPSLKYFVYKNDPSAIMSLKPFSLGVTLSYGLK